MSAKPKITLSLTTLALCAELASGTTRCEAAFPLGKNVRVEVRTGSDSLWIIWQEKEEPRFALRTVYAPGVPLAVRQDERNQNSATFCLDSSLGAWEVTLHIETINERYLLWATTRLKPSVTFAPQFYPRDLYLLGKDGDIHAAQRGVNSGLVYATQQTESDGQTLLYFQNLTALNSYFVQTGTTPDGCVGGTFPELGYAPPLPAPEKSIGANREITVSDVRLVVSPEVPDAPPVCASLFLTLLADVYRTLDKPQTEFHDWQAKASDSLRDLANAPEASQIHDGHRYLRPYTDAEVPDSMVQLTVLSALHDYAAWLDKPVPLADDLRAGVPKFFDNELHTLRRYLPDVASEKNADAVDSWYLYHPLICLGRLAQAGDTQARDLFLKSLDFGINVAHHFRYEFPVMFHLRTLDVITGERQPDAPGQSDVGGLFAYTCLQAYELTGFKCYVEEAKNALRALAPRSFDLLYQTNITAWGAVAALWLAHVTGNASYREQSYVFLAGFFHNCLLWESEIGTAKQYPIFLGATCLHDAPYMAIFECFESFVAFHEYLERGGSETPDAVRLLLAESVKYTLTRAWYYYPGELPEEILATEIRNGHIDRALAFPLEDLYGDGQPAGQVGQEVYGSGAAFALLSRAFHRIPNVPFVLFAEYPVYDLSVSGDGKPCRVTFQVRGASDAKCHVRLLPRKNAPIPPVVVTGERKLSVRAADGGGYEFAVHAQCPVSISWRLLDD